VQEDGWAWKITKNCVEEKLPIFPCPYTAALVRGIQIELVVPVEIK
jgi:hypothetical protein